MFSCVFRICSSITFFKSHTLVIPKSFPLLPFFLFTISFDIYIPFFSRLTVHPLTSTISLLNKLTSSSSFLPFLLHLFLILFSFISFFLPSYFLFFISSLHYLPLYFLSLSNFFHPSHLFPPIFSHPLCGAPSSTFSFLLYRLIWHPPTSCFPPPFILSLTSSFWSLT